MWNMEVNFARSSGLRVSDRCVVTQRDHERRSIGSVLIMGCFFTLIGVASRAVKEISQRVLLSVNERDVSEILGD